MTGAVLKPPPWSPPPALDPLLLLWLFQLSLCSSCPALFFGLCCICWCFLQSFSTAHTSFGWFHLKPWVQLLSNSHNSSTSGLGQDLSSMLWPACVVKPSVWSLSSMIWESDRLRFESWLYLLLAVWLGSGILSSLCFIFLSCKPEIIMYLPCRAAEKIKWDYVECLHCIMYNV